MSSHETDCSHIENALLKDNTKQKVVLVGTGSYNPVHIGHIEVFAQIRKQLEENHHFQVLGAYISPSHWDYISHKLRDDAIPDDHRCKMIELAISEAGYSDWLKLDRWELNQEYFLDYPDIVKRMSKFLDQKFKNHKIRVIYCAGADHVRKCGCWELRKGSFGVACVSRPGYNQISGDHVFPIDSSLQFDISSTLIRKALKNKEDLSQLEYKSVVDYMLKNKILC